MSIPDREQLDALVGGIISLGEDVQKLQVEVADDRKAREEENRTRQQENKRTKFLVFLAGLVGVIGLSVGGWGLDKASTANDAARDAETALVRVCQHTNEFLTAHNNLAQQNINERQRVIAATEAGDGTPEQKAQTREFFEREIAAYEANILPLREC